MAQVDRDERGRAVRVHPSLRAQLAPFILRRTKQQVLPWLPPKQRQVISVPITERSLVTELDRTLREAGGEVVLEETLEGIRGTVAKMMIERSLSTVMMALAIAKIPVAREIARSLPGPVMISSAHVAPVDVLGRQIGWGRIAGDVSLCKRQAVIDQHQAGDLIGIALTMAGAEGITLTRGHEHIAIDLDWLPGINTQMEDRQHRAGQTETVHVQQLVAQHPVDEIKRRVLERKMWFLESMGLDEL